MIYRFWALCLLLSTHMLTAAEIQQNDQSIAVTLSNDVTLRWLQQDGYVLGMQQAVAAGVPTTSEQTLRFPIFNDEWDPQRGVYPFLKLKIVESNKQGGVTLTCSLHGNESTPLWAAYYLMRPDIKRARTENWNNVLDQLEAAAQQARSVRDTWVTEQPELLEALSIMEQAKDKKAKKKIRGQARKLRKGGLDRLKKTLGKKWAEIPDHAALAQAISAFTQASQAAGLEVGKVHRDFYRFAILQLPSEVCGVDKRLQALSQFKEELNEVGTVLWHINPHTETIAGWPYQGWQESFEVTMHNGASVDAMRVLGTWEIDGDAAKNTVVNMRYRGIGGIEHSIGANGAESTFTTTETIPGAAGGAPVISPAVPSGQSVSDRGFGIRHRVGAWIAQMARGAGVSVMDFQWSGDQRHILASWPIRMGNLRAVTEIFPGDKHISRRQTYFPHRHRTHANHTRYAIYSSAVSGLFTQPGITNERATHSLDGMRSTRARSHG